MKIEIDQSGKIENTNRLTVIAYSNKESGSILITAKDKRLIQTLFRKAGTPSIFVYKTFAVLIFILIKDKLKATNQVIIDREYLGYEKLIKQFIIELCQRSGLNIQPEIIHFKEIGKKSKAHKIAISGFRSKKANIKVTYRDFLKIAL